MFNLRKKIIFLFLCFFVLTSCSKTGTKNVDKLNNEIKNSSTQFSLTTEEINVLKKSYSEFTDSDKELFNKILEKYNKFKNESSNDNAFEAKILEKLQEIENFYEKKYINFKNESSIDVKVEEKLLDQNKKIALNKMDLTNENYLIKLTEKGKFIYSVNNKIILEEVMKENDKPRYVRIKILDNSNVEFKGDIIGIIFKDNIKYNTFKNLPSGIYDIDKDINGGTYRISNTTKDIKIKVMNKNNEITVLKLEDYNEVKLDTGMKLIISGVDYITLEKID
ncbi:hypothetical protein [uncultured Parvimonas sp.]|uniref:hypothetical protein n=1 Tax=uncultured Parvimonas sp. TaxID=747372 RepID=UPI0028D3AB29|nr:hypothetical protein [uncultured Parvimonas sp.]